MYAIITIVTTLKSAYLTLFRHNYPHFNVYYETFDNITFPVVNSSWWLFVELTLKVSVSRYTGLNWQKFTGRKCIVLLALPVVAGCAAGINTIVWITKERPYASLENLRNETKRLWNAVYRKTHLPYIHTWFSVFLT